jgi:molybdopterin converting factor small subunit
MSLCTFCNQEKEESEFNNYKNKKRCKSCIKIYNKNYRTTNLEKFKQYKKTDKTKLKNKEYKQRLKKQIQDWGKEYFQKNKEKILKYRQDNKEKIRETDRKRAIERFITEPNYKLRIVISAYLHATFKKKKRESLLKYLPYTLDELKQHLESQFEPWMTWNNHGRYLKSWNEDESSTWTWQIDHIIPQSIFKYDSIQDDNFKKCWALENLRPYSAKQNVLDGIYRTRHNQ